MTIHIIITMLLLLAFLIGKHLVCKKKYQMKSSYLGLECGRSLSLREFWKKTGAYLDLHPQKNSSVPSCKIILIYIG